MPVTQIQLRGISRNPSDKSTADGGCAESLNLQVLDQELAPATTPKIISSQLGLWEENEGYKVLHIHKNNLLIERVETPLTPPSLGYSKDSSYSEIVELFDGEEISDIQSIGNTLIVSTSRRSLYVLWDNDTYTFLGEQVPMPKIEVTDTATTGLEKDVVFNQVAYRANVTDENVSILEVPVLSLDENIWNSILNNTYDHNDPLGHKALIDKIIARIWDTIQVMVNNNRKNGYFSTPLLMRYAVKLYNGDYMYQSEPVLLGALGSAYLYNRQTSLTIGLVDNNTFESEIHFTPQGVHKVKVKLDESFNVGKWSDIIESIDIFLSPDIYTPKLYTEFESLSVENHAGLNYREGTLKLKDAPASEEEDLVLAASNFYKVASFPIDDLSELVEGYEIEPKSQDDLVTLPRLTDDQGSHDAYIGLGNSMVYNNRLFYSGYKSILYSGATSFLAPMSYSSNQVPEADVDSSNDYYYIFHIKDSQGKSHKVKSQVNLPNFAADRQTGVFGWIVYPNTKCYKVDVVVKKNNNVVYSYKMEEHPLLNCSYCFLGFGKGLFSGDSEIVAVSPTDAIDNAQAQDQDARTILMSEVDNPFIFPTKYRHTFTKDIIGLATTTKALSAGQFGSFPLYAFTMDGIWALPINAEGVIESAAPLSRDIAIKGTISPIDQAIVFITDKGVMLLSGSEIQSISPNMNGAHYAIEEDAENILDEDWRLFLPILRDDTSFVTFMKGAKLGYDYAGERLIAFNTDHPEYQYAYYIKANTLHKIGTYSITGIDTILNSYPALYVAVKIDNTTQIYDYSTYLENAPFDAGFYQGNPCIAITRPFDMDLPDVRKCISDIRIRGRFDKKKVHYILLGSMDGSYFGILRSLRGGSFKSFRLIILAMLADADRISWIDVQYEPRFTNKLR